MSDKQPIEDASPASTTQQQADQQTPNNTYDKQVQLNKKLDMIYKQVKALFALRYTKTDKQPNLIIPHLYLGSVGAALSKNVLIELNIKYVLTAMDEMKFPFPDIINEYKIIRVKDSKTEDMMTYFNESNEFIHKAISNNENILVHCFAGISRSTTFVLAYLMKHQNKTLEQAFTLAQTARPQVKPNDNFLKQLKIYESSLNIKQNDENINKEEIDQCSQDIEKLNIQDKSEINESNQQEQKSEEDVSQQLVKQEQPEKNDNGENERVLNQQEQTIQDEKLNSDQQNQEPTDSQISQENN